MKKDRNFDIVIDRRNTGSFKWGGEKYGLEDGKIIPMWVADMDFRCAEPIVKAVEERARHGIYGYPNRDASYGDIIVGWHKRRFGCEPKRESLSFAPPGVIYAAYVALKLLTEKGDKVLVLMPNYDPLFEMIEKSGRAMLQSPLLIDEELHVSIDFADLEEKMKEAKLLIISNPHNPSGRVWTREELSKTAELADRYGVFVISDEIHADFVSRAAGHVPYYSVSEKAAENSMCCYSANKGFNLGGFQTSTLVIGDKELKARFDEEMNLGQTRLDNIFGAVATKTAYTDPACEEWLDDAIEYVEGNKQYLYDFLQRQLPQLKAVPSEGTYLVWVDCTGLGLAGGEALEEFFLQKAKVEPCMGYEFGRQGEQFVRLNLACPRAIVEKALDRLKEACRSL